MCTSSFPVPTTRPRTPSLQAVAVTKRRTCDSEDHQPPTRLALLKAFLPTPIGRQSHAISQLHGAQRFPDTEQTPKWCPNANTVGKPSATTSNLRLSQAHRTVMSRCRTKILVVTLTRLLSRMFLLNTPAWAPPARWLPEASTTADLEKCGKKGSGGGKSCKKGTGGLHGVSKIL